MSSNDRVVCQYLGRKFYMKERCKYDRKARGVSAKAYEIQRDFIGTIKRRLRAGCARIRRWKVDKPLTEATNLT